MITENDVKTFPLYIIKLKQSSLKRVRIHWKRGFFFVKIKDLISKKDDNVNLNITFFKGLRPTNLKF